VSRQTLPYAQPKAAIFDGTERPLERGAADGAQAVVRRLGVTGRQGSWHPLAEQFGVSNPTVGTRPGMQSRRVQTIKLF